MSKVYGKVVKDGGDRNQLSRHQERLIQRASLSVVRSSVRTITCSPDFQVSKPLKLGAYMEILTLSNQAAGRCRTDTRGPANSDAGAKIRRERAVEASEQAHCAPFPALVSHHECTHLNKTILSILDHCFSPPLLEASQNHSLIHGLQSLLSPFSLSAYPPSSDFLSLKFCF